MIIYRELTNVFMGNKKLALNLHFMEWNISLVMLMLQFTFFTISLFSENHIFSVIICFNFISFQFICSFLFNFYVKSWRTCLCMRVWMELPTILFLLNTLIVLHKIEIETMPTFVMWTSLVHSAAFYYQFDDLRLHHVHNMNRITNDYS